VTKQTAVEEVGMADIDLDRMESRICYLSALIEEMHLKLEALKLQREQVKQRRNARNQYMIVKYGSNWRTDVHSR
jgi:hypothetical protein